MNLRAQMVSNMIELGFDEELVTYYQSTALPTAKIRLQERETYQRLGNSRIGGYPDLPAGLDYPTVTEEGVLRHFVFIAQINLSELPSAVATPYPNQGLLYFFIHNDDESMSTVRHLILYSGENTSDLVTFKPPANIQYTGASYSRPFPAYAIAFESEYSVDLPHLETHQSEYLQQRDELYDVFNRVSRFGGHHYSVDGIIPADIMQEKNLLSSEELFFLTRGYLTGERSYEETSQVHIDYYEKKIAISDDEGEISRAQESIREIRDKIDFEKSKEGQEGYYRELLNNWQLMLVIDSIDECNMLWWDSSSLEFYVNADDLRKGDWSNTHCIINH